jgi:hypothetical protein
MKEPLINKRVKVTVKSDAPTLYKICMPAGSNYHTPPIDIIGRVVREGFGYSGYEISIKDDTGYVYNYMDKYYDFIIQPEDGDYQI